jgi:hypothetical protein
MNTKFIKKQLYLTEAQQIFVETESKRLGLSQSAFFKKAIEAYRQSKENQILERLERIEHILSGTQVA